MHRLLDTPCPFNRVCPQAFVAVARRVVACLVLLAGPSSVLAGEASVGVTTLHWLPEALEAHGLVVAPADALPAIDFPQRTDSTLRASTVDFEGWGAGALRHDGGLSVATGGVTLTLNGFELVAAPEDSTALALRDNGGRRWFDIGFPQVTAVAGRFHAENADLTMAADLAERLGRPELAGMLVGDVELTLPDATVVSTRAITSPAGCVETAGTIDLEMIDLRSPVLVAKSGARIAMSFAATLRNVGTASVDWYRSIAPDGVVGPHPYLALHLYRIDGDVITQIGRADIKHAFFATNQGCPCSGAQVIFPSCTDTYGAGTNVRREFLAPRAEVSAFSGDWTRIGSHFDGLPVNDVRDHGGDDDHDALEHRLVVADADLATPDARYFIEGWYVVGGDIDIFNSMAHRRIQPNRAGAAWNFSLADGLEHGSILDRYVAETPDATTTLVDTGEGRIQLAVVARDLGDGVWRYTYALMNFDIDRQVRALSLPLDTAAVVSNVGFIDTDEDSGNDWIAQVVDGRLSFAAPAGNALDWGTLYVFSFDTDRAPTDTTAGLDLLEPGIPTSLTLETTGPTPLAATATREVPLPTWALAALGFLCIALAPLGARRLKQAATGRRA